VGRAHPPPLRPRRLFAPRLPDAGGDVPLDADGLHHAHVLRLRPGDPIELFDGRGRVAQGVVEVMERRRVVCRVGAPRRELSRGPRTVLVLGAPKGKKLDGVLRMITELGVDALFVAPSDHAVARPELDRGSAKVGRLEKIALEAARQAERATVPALETASSLLEAAASAPPGATRLCFWARGGRPLGEVVAEGATPEEVWLVVGPEGGLSDAELEGLDALGYARVTLGPHVLRAETAAVAAVAAVVTRLEPRGDPDVPGR